IIVVGTPVSIIPTEESKYESKNNSPPPSLPIKESNTINIPASLPVPPQYHPRSNVEKFDLGSGDYLEMVYIKGGEFEMGSSETETAALEDEHPLHKVILSDYFIGKYEVTRKQFQLFVNETGYITDAERGTKTEGKGSMIFPGFYNDPSINWRNPGFEQGDNHPVTCVSWNDAQKFCEWLSKKTNKSFCLPSEAQWEYACRAGSNTFFFRETMEAGHGLINFLDMSTAKRYNLLFYPYSDKFESTAPVGSFKPNDFGLYDMAGNVFEWCFDWYDSKAYEKAANKNTFGPVNGKEKVYRGGGWFSTLLECRPARRRSIEPQRRSSWIGFRVARLVNSQTSSNSIQNEMIPLSQIQPKPFQTENPANINSTPSPTPLNIPKTGTVRKVDLGDGIILEMVYIPSGTYDMGCNDGEPDERPVHMISVDGFWIGKYEVTQEQYKAVMGTNPSHFKGVNNPVEMVSWYDAMEFCKKLSQKTRMNFTLPSEAQWEYACRARTQTRFSFGDNVGDLWKYGNYCDASNTSGFSWKDKAHNDGNDKTSPVGSYRPNSFGLYDMHGNVWEWCLDFYDEGFYRTQAASRRNPINNNQSKKRVLRSGSWFHEWWGCRSTDRICYPPDARIDYNGFRVVSSSL
ncbi:MAG TPA: SUMF1/EgtB/PvdO family nonheme iron enzyme, partial [Candidatus Sumerlaeia bacterium]|nr:SUMF1/EgtB/PvdO family nonheme iron enzyme [Candidatus Sumerlaeia bacterium]